MNEINNLIEKLELAIADASEEKEFLVLETQKLIALSSQAVGVLKCLKGFNMKQIMYDMARLAAVGGYAPDDFDDKANS